MPTTVLLAITFGGLAVAAVLAALRGSWVDRAVVAAFIANEAASAFLIDPNYWGAVQRGAFLADLALLAVLLVVTVRWPRTYLLVLSILQLAMVGVHVARLIPAPLHQAGYAFALFVLTEVQVLTLPIGLALVRRRPKPVS